ncbi:hypothetical protein ACROYT_G032328 [Oculina patagonica]
MSLRTTKVNKRKKKSFALSRAPLKAIDPVLKEIIVNNRFHSTSRGSLANISFPTIAASGAHTLHSKTPDRITDVSTVSQIPSKSNCEHMLHTFMSAKYAAITCSVGTYTKSSLETLLKIHLLRDISRQVNQEMQWLRMTPQPPNEQCAPPGILDDFNKLLFAQNDGKVVLGKATLPSDLATLTGNNWVNIATIQVFVDLLNANSYAETAAFILNDLISLNETELHRWASTIQRVKQMKSIAFIINVAGGIKETRVATPANPGCHWTLLYVDTVQNKWFYCDTLGWAPPTNLKSTVDSILYGFSSYLGSSPSLREHNPKTTPENSPGNTHENSSKNTTENSPGSTPEKSPGSTPENSDACQMETIFFAKEIYTNDWAVKVRGGQQEAVKLALKYGFSYDKQVEWFMHQKEKKYQLFSAKPKDPMFKDQWYIERRDGSSEPTFNIISAWAANYTGKGILVAVVDDGVDGSHPELKTNYNSTASYDYVDGEAVPFGKQVSGHGNMCAGVIAGLANNNKCGVGLAYNAKIAGIRLFDDDIKSTDATESKALIHEIDSIDIYSNSWGPGDMAWQGRGGLGAIYTFAAGNGGITGDSCAYNGYVNSIYTIAINGVNPDGSNPSYAEECPGIMATAYSADTFLGIGKVKARLRARLAFFVQDALMILEQLQRLPPWRQA